MKNTKKFYTLFLASIIAFSTSACSQAGKILESADVIPSRSEQETEGLKETEISEETEETENFSENSANPQGLDGILSSMTARTESAVETITSSCAAVIDNLGGSYDTYSKSQSSVPEFYADSQKNAEELYAGFEAMSIEYFKGISRQGLDDYRTWNDAMDDFYDTWNDSMDDYYDAWNDSYEELYDTCNDLIEDAADHLEYREYSDAWSDMYENYSESWSDMYEAYSDAWSRTYGNYSDVWSGFYNDETDVDSILKTAAEKESSEAETSANTEPPQTTAAAPSDSGLSDNETSLAADSEGIRPEFQEAMDTYEAFYDEYCGFMKQYKENPSDLQLLAEYSDILSKAADMNEAFQAWEENELNNEELKYYLEVNNQVMQKLVDVAS